ncbi:MAG TPA: nucleotide pyrophosphohydrolase [Bacillota bacterium]
MKNLMRQAVAFRDERDWKQFHNPKDLAVSLCLEAAELLENFQWKTSDEAVGKRRAEIADELADVFIYGLFLADALGLDPGETVLAKLAKNARKYPVAKARGSSRKYTELD